MQQAWRNVAKSLGKRRGSAATVALPQTEQYPIATACGVYGTIGVNTPPLNITCAPDHWLTLRNRYGELSVEHSLPQAQQHRPIMRTAGLQQRPKPVRHHGDLSQQLMSVFCYKVLKSFPNILKASSDAPKDGFGEKPGLSA